MPPASLNDPQAKIPCPKISSRILGIPGTGFSKNATFSKKRDGIGGTIEHKTATGEKISKLKLLKINQTEQSIEFSHNGKSILVEIEADAYENNHFINPRYFANINGEKVSFAIKDGEACYGFSTHLIFMIMGSYLH